MLLVKAKIGLLNRADVLELFLYEQILQKTTRYSVSYFYTPRMALLGPSSSPSHFTNCRIPFLPKTDNAAYQLMESLWKSEFLKGTAVLDTPNFKEDRVALGLMQDLITIHKGHYQIPLL